MRALLAQIGIKLVELADLLLEDEDNIRKWFKRNQSLPAVQNRLLAAIGYYATRYTRATALAELSPHLEQEFHREASEKVQQEMVLIEKKLTQYYYQQTQLQEKWEIQVYRIHFAQHYLELLDQETPINETVQDWPKLIARKSHSALRKLWYKRQALTKKIAKLEAELAFLKT